jgi:chemotaxis protein CheC
MELTPRQNDALTELINIGYARAAGALSELTGHRITLDVPKVDIHYVRDISGILGRVMNGEVASVNQGFSGPVSGNALLLLDEQAAILLNRLLMDDESLDTMDSAAREVIVEVGNILLNACLGAFGNLLRVQVSFSVPRLRVEAVENILESITVDQEELNGALMVHTRFHLRKSNVSGYMMMILGVVSLDRLLLELEKWEERQMTG